MVDPTNIDFDTIDDFNSEPKKSSSLLKVVICIAVLLATYNALNYKKRLDEN